MPQNHMYEGPESYSNYGFSIVRNVLSESEVREIRGILDGLFKKGPYVNRPMFLLDEFFKRSLLYKAVFQKRVVEGLKHCLTPDLTFIPDFNVHHNFYGLPGWHADCGSESGNVYLYDKNYKFAKCGIFFQSYDNGWGGSIYVKPFSHRAYLTSHRWLSKFLKALTRIQVKLNLNTLLVPARAGDMLVFDSRLYHQSSEPAPSNLKNFKEIDVGLWTVPNEHAKYVIYWDSCYPAMVDDHMQNSIKRANLEQPNPTGKVGKEPVFTENMSFYYPDDYPAEIVRLVNELGIKMASLPKAKCEQFKNKLSMLTGQLGS
jgi:hypothetical protein